MESRRNLDTLNKSLIKQLNQIQFSNSQMIKLKLKVIDVRDAECASELKMEMKQRLRNLLHSPVKLQNTLKLLSRREASELRQKSAN